MTKKVPMKELRVGLVLYGGVSLAVYMNGVVTELWHALRASQSRNPNGEVVDGAAAVYRDLLDNLKRLKGGGDLRIVLDTIAGTSAGGVNGAVLGKAIATGANAGILNKTWVEDAGIEALAGCPPLRTPFLLRAVDFLEQLFSRKFEKIRRFLDRIPKINWVWARDHVYSTFASEDSERTPLKGDYFTKMIARTLKLMDHVQGVSNLLPPGGRLDLVLTRTDLYGWPRHLAVDPRFHDDLSETAHAHRMRFRYHRPLSPTARTRINDFTDDFSLTYAARTTAGFPLAFAPASYQTVRRAYLRARGQEAIPASDTFAALHLPEHALNSYSADTTWMVDGGVLDNKPFSAVTQLIEQKPANRAVYRVLMYIEPDPSLIDRAKPAPMPSPKKMPGLLYKLFRHEPIFADLQTIASRNRLVVRLVSIAETTEIDAVRIMHPFLDVTLLDANGLAKVREATNDTLCAGNNPGYPGYIMLKAKKAADTLAAFVSSALGYPYESSHGYFIRTIVREWLKHRDAFEAPEFNSKTERYESSAAQLELLDAFDISYRLRRLRNMVRIANDLYDKEGAEAQQLDSFKSKLMRVLFAFDGLIDPDDEQSQWITAFFHSELGTDDLDTFIRDYGAHSLATINDDERNLDNLYGRLRDYFRRSMQAQDVYVRNAIAELPSDLREPIARAYALFRMIDSAVFPMMYSAGIGDLTTIRVVRISPHDAKSLSDDPWRLESREIGAFAGFLSRSAREYDLMWGRLDGAERLIDQIVTAVVGEKWDDAVRALRADALTRAITAILDESAQSACSIRPELIRDLRRRLPIHPAKE